MSFNATEIEYTWNGKSAQVRARKYDLSEYQQLRCSRISTPRSNGTAQK